MPGWGQKRWQLGGHGACLLLSLQPLGMHVGRSGQGGLGLLAWHAAGLPQKVLQLRRVQRGGRRLLRILPVEGMLCRACSRSFGGARLSGRPELVHGCIARC